MFMTAETPRNISGDHRVSRRAYQAGEKIIEKGRRDSGEDYDKVFPHIGIQLVRHLQKARDIGSMKIYTAVLIAAVTAKMSTNDCQTESFSFSRSSLPM